MVSMFTLIRTNKVLLLLLQKKQEENIEEISEKVKKLNEPGETVESIFCEIEDTCTT